MLGLLDRAEYLDPRLKPQASGRIYCNQQRCRSVRKGSYRSDASEIANWCLCV
jgi:hypothetical protein